MYDAVSAVNAGLKRGVRRRVREVRNGFRGQNLLAWGFEGFVRLARTAWLLLENALATFFTKNGNSLLSLNGYFLGQTPVSHYDLTRGLPERPSGPRSSDGPSKAPCQQVWAAEPVSHFAYAPSNAPRSGRRSQSRPHRTTNPSHSGVRRLWSNVISKNCQATKPCGGA